MYKGTVTGRVVCAACLRPVPVCVCAFIEPRHPRTQVLLLQHPREHRVPINTVRIASLCLPTATIRVGVSFGDDPIVQRTLADPSRTAVLLYPGRGSRDLRTDRPVGDLTLVVLDGTWWQAERLLKSNPWLASLPRYAFTPSQPGRYRIRREPAEHCVATIEALAETLSLLEEDPSIATSLLRPFDVMVERQLAYAAHEGHGRARTRRARTLRDRPTPAVLHQRPNDVVIAYGEANAWPYGTEGAPPHEIVHWVAERYATGERFEALVVPKHPLTASFEHHTGIGHAAVAAGESFEAFHARWLRFVRDDDVLCTWGVYATDVLTSAGVVLPPRVDLRTAAAVFLASRAGALEACPARFGVETEAPWAMGRSGVRLAALAAVARALGRRTTDQ